MDNELNGAIPNQQAEELEPKPMDDAAAAARMQTKSTSKDSLETAKLLDSIADEARRGEIVAVAVIKVRGPANFGLSVTGNGLMEQFIGCAMMMDNLKGLMSGALVIHEGQIVPAQYVEALKQQEAQRRANRLVRATA